MVKAAMVIQWLGGLMAFTALGFVLYGLLTGSRRKAGRASGRAGSWLLSPWIYVGSTIFFFGLAYLGWTPLPWEVSGQARTVMLAAGSLLYFPGMTLLLWARVTLGKNYFVSSGFGAQLFSDQQLVTSGPYALVRHPMYAGLILSALGSLLIYVTWTTVFFACFSPLMFVRARHEEADLSAEFGEEWQEYSQNVPAFIPRLRRKR
jgi:protein-S-isoprenylcysteine O-methyltransferase Ste14